MTELEAFAAHWRLPGQVEHTIECYLSVLRRFAETTALETTSPLDMRVLPHGAVADGQRSDDRPRRALPADVLPLAFRDVGVRRPIEDVEAAADPRADDRVCVAGVQQASDVLDPGQGVRQLPRPPNTLQRWPTT
jgi:hypothetical protein